MTSVSRPLYELFLSLFPSGEDFRRWIPLLPDGCKIARELPGDAASAAATILRGLEVLVSRGHVDDGLFRSLVEAFPRRYPCIQRVARAHGIRVRREPGMNAARAACMSACESVAQISAAVNLWSEVLGCIVSVRTNLRVSRLRDHEPRQQGVKLTAEQPVEDGETNRDFDDPSAVNR